MNDSFSHKNYVLRAQLLIEDIETVSGFLCPQCGGRSRTFFSLGAVLKETDCPLCSGRGIVLLMPPISLKNTRTLEDVLE